MPAALFRLVVTALVFAVALATCGTWAASVAIMPRAPLFLAKAQARSLERRIADRDHERMRAAFPEGGLFTLSFTGFALVDIALANPDDTEYRAHVVDELAVLLRDADRERKVAPFASMSSTVPWRGVILEGHENLLRAGYAVLGGDDARILADYHRTSADLYARFTRAPAGAIESFWGRTWYVDNAVALESLRLHDVMYGTHYALAVARFAAKLRTHRDARTGMPASEISLDDTHTLDGPRGCALSWLFAFPDVVDAVPPGHGAHAGHELAPAALDDDRAVEGDAGAGYGRYARAWSVDVAGMRGFREYPVTRRGRADVDSGPIVDGIGGAASAFGVAAARANDDGDQLGRMLVPLAILTAPMLTMHGDVALFGGQIPIADAITLWARTVTPWDAPRAAPSTSPPLAPILVAVLVLLAPVVLTGFALLRALRPWGRGSRTAAPSTSTPA